MASEPYTGGFRKPMKPENAGSHNSEAHETDEPTGRDVRDRDDAAAAPDRENAGTEIGQSPACTRTNSPDADNAGDPDEVYIAQNGHGRTGIYHTDPDCSHYQSAGNPTAVSRDDLFDDADECYFCAEEGSSNPRGSTGGGHYEAALDWDPDDDIVADGGAQTVKACPDCGSSRMRPRAGGIHGVSPEVEGDYQCRECALVFDHPAERECRATGSDEAGRGNISEAGRAAMEADSDIRTDGGGLWRQTTDDRLTKRWTHQKTGLRVELTGFRGPVERLSGTEPDDAEHWIAVVRPPESMGEAPVKILDDRDRIQLETALERARDWMESHENGVPTTYSAETASEYHDGEFVVAGGGGR